MREESIQNKKTYEDLKKRSGKLTLGLARPLFQAIWAFCERNDYPDSFGSYAGAETAAIREAYKKLTGKEAQSCQNVQNFLCPSLLAGLKRFYGKEETDRIEEECRMIVQFPYSHSVYRPSYRSSHAGDYADLFFRALISPIYEQCRGEKNILTRYVYRLSLDLRQEDAAAYAAVEEAILGGNTEVTFSHTIISAIVKSGNPKALELLGGLFLAAKGQEGLRQAVLETCDSGLIESHTYFIRLILEHGLCRFSSVIRAFDTWCGLSFGDQKQKTVEKMMALALHLTEDQDAARAALFSADTTEIYMGLWAVSLHDVHSATDLAVNLLQSPEKYRRLTGWYFITHTNNAGFRHSLATRFLDVRDPEELAWISANLRANSEISRGYWGGYGKYEEKDEQELALKTYPVDYYPSDKKSRLALFEQAALAVRFIGKKSSKFSPSVFPWCEVQLSPASLLELMIGLAGYDRREELILDLAKELPLMDSGNRMKYYGRLLTPRTPGHRALLLTGLSDKSPSVKEMILKRLMFYPLDTNDTAVLEKSLTTTSAGLRKAVITLLEKQDAGLISPVIDHLLNSPDNRQILAGTELLEVFGKKEPGLGASYQEKIAALRTGGSLGEDFEILARRIYPDHASPSELTPENGFGLFDPKDELFQTAYWAEKRPKLPALSDSELKARIVPDEKETIALYRRLLAVWQENKDYEYETQNYIGGREMVLLGSRITKLSVYDRENPKGIYDYPLSGQWLDAAGDYFTSPEKLAAVMSIGEWVMERRNMRNGLAAFLTATLWRLTKTRPHKPS